MKYLSFFLLFVGVQGLAIAQYRINEIPNPKEKGQDFFVCNPDGILSSYAVDSLDAMIGDIEKKTTAEVAIVAISNFQGDDDFEFALKLFNTWGVGKKENDNGLLLLIAKDRRAYRFITGYGMEAVLPDALLKRIGENYLVPHFKNGDYDKGVMAAMAVIRDVLLSPTGAEELKADLRKQSFFYKYRDILISSLMMILLTLAVLKWIGYVAEKKIVDDKRRKNVGQNGLSMLGGCGCLVLVLFAGVFALWFFGGDPKAIFQVRMVPWYIAFAGSATIATKYAKGEEYIRKAYRDEKNRLTALSRFHRWMVIPLLLSPISLIGFFVFLKRKASMKVRFVPPDDSGNWIRMDRDALKKKTDLLDSGQLAEEQNLSRSYELWEHRESGAVKAVAWPGKKAKKYSLCPSCQYHTLKKPFVITIRRATYSAAGEGEKLQECANCDYRISLGKVKIAKKTRSSSSSGGGRSSGGGSSSSGSFGGGSSGGGGAGGRW